MGNLTRDPELRYASTGTAICNATVALNRGKGDRKKTTFVDCVFFGKAAETVTQYFGKGKPLVVIGELEQDQWQDRESGEERSKIKVNARSFEFVPRGGGSGDDDVGGRNMTHRRKSSDASIDKNSDEVPF